MWALPALTLDTGLSACLQTADAPHAWRLDSLLMPHLTLSTALVDDPRTLHSMSQRLDGGTLVEITRAQLRMDHDKAGFSCTFEAESCLTRASNSRLSIAAAFVRAAAAPVRGLFGRTPSFTSRVGVGADS